MILANKQESYSPILCIEHNQLVCFFVLDSGDDRVLYTNNRDSLLLRGFSTDSHHTKKGYATTALKHLPVFVRTHFPNITHVYLGVNVKNELAGHLYEKVGFVDTKRIFEGPKGSQRILKLTIK